MSHPNKNRNYAGRNYVILPYNPKWVKQFTAESKVIRTAFEDPELEIEHIGSTAVPGMSGKPLIDILVIISDIDLVDPHVEAMERAGYTAYGDFLEMKSYLFAREINGQKLVNVHVFETGHPHIKEMLAVRDFLRNNLDEAKAYSRLKNQLYKQYPTDYAGYREAKDEYVEDLISRLPN